MGGLEARVERRRRSVSPLHALIPAAAIATADQLLALLRRQLLKAFERGVQLFALRRRQLAGTCPG
jgi:hypothetical protein